MATGYRRALDDTIPLSCVIEGFVVRDGHTVGIMFLCDFDCGIDF